MGGRDGGAEVERRPGEDGGRAREGVDADREAGGENTGVAEQRRGEEGLVGTTLPKKRRR